MFYFARLFTGCRLFERQTRLFATIRPFANIPEPAPRPPPTPRSKEWKMFYKDDSHDRMKQAYWGTAFLYGSIGLVLGTYVYLVHFARSEKTTTLKREYQDHPEAPYVIGVMHFSMFILLVWRRRYLVLEMFKNTKKLDQYYLVRLDWLLRKKIVEFNRIDMKINRSQSNNRLQSIFTELYGNLSLSVGDRFRTMRLFDYNFTSVEDRMKFFKEVC